MPVAEIIAIGTELLLGEIQDTNTAAIARTLRDAGIDLYRATIVGDNPERIARAIREALDRSDIVITTGGLGPTVDDPTRAAVAKAFGTDLEFRPELWAQIKARFSRYHSQATENNRRQAFIPRGAIPIENQVGTAPAFYYQNGAGIVISLPGVPREMEHLLQQQVIPLLRDHYHLQGIIKAYVLHAAGVGESQVDEWIANLETQENPTVGLLAHAGQVDIRVTAKADSEQEADAMIAKTVEQIRQQVGAAIYGSNQDTLEQVVLAQLENIGKQLIIIEYGLDGLIAQKLSTTSSPRVRSLVISQNGSPAELQQMAQSEIIKNQQELILAAGLYPGALQQDLYLYLITPDRTREANRSYGGPPQSGPQWAVNTALDFIRRNIT